MFQKSKINEPIDPRGKSDAAKPSTLPKKPVSPSQAPYAAARKAAPSVISTDLRVIGNLETDGDLQIEGTVEGDIRAQVLTIGKTAHVKGEIRAHDVVVNGRVNGKIRGMKVQLAESAQVTGDVIHATISIESGANFEGSVQRSENPLEAPQAAPGTPAGSVTELTAQTISAGKSAGAME